MTIAVRFDHVSKKFPLQRNRPQSFQELLINLAHGRFRQNISKDDAFWVLKDVSFTISKGETVGFIGINGAGKSTILKLVSQILYPTLGEIEINGRIGALLELGAGFHPDMTGRENVYLNASMLGLSRAEIDGKIDDIIAFAELEKFIDVQVKHYSSGMYVRLGFAVAVNLRPDILVVDEVLAVGDAAFQRKCMEHIHHMRRQGITILFVSHSPDLVERLCNRVIWLEDGELRGDGNVQDVLMDYSRFSYEQSNQDKDEETEQTEMEQASRWGSGEALVEKVRLLNQAGEETNLFTTGDTLVLEISYEAKQKITAPVFGLGIHRDDGVHIAGPNTNFSSYPISYIEGQGVIHYTISQLSLLEGTYQLSVAIADETTTHLFDYHDRLYAFQVQPAEFGDRLGLLALPGEWALSPLQDEIQQ